MSALERCCLGLPSLIVVLADNQCENANVLRQAGAAIDLGRLETLSVRTIAERLRSLVDDRKAREVMIGAAARITDGRGVERVLEALLPFHPVAQKISRAQT